MLGWAKRNRRSRGCARAVDSVCPILNHGIMDTDDIAPPPRAGDPIVLLVKLDLDPFSVTELDARIVVLEAEIVRTKAKRDKAVNHRASADALFGR